MPKMIITSAQITSYHSPVTIYHYEKQTQTKPILSRAQPRDLISIADKIAPLFRMSFILRGHALTSSREPSKQLLPLPLNPRIMPYNKMAKRQTHNKSLPEPSLEHLKRLTDDTGLLQHARYTIPYREEGYCTDDNARAVIVATRYYTLHPEPQVLELFNTYLAFVLHSQNGDGSVKNLMNFDRTWRKNEAGNDALGRVLWALGVVLAKPPSPAYLPIIREYFVNSAVHAEKQSPRGMAYAMLGMSEYLKQFPKDGEIKSRIETTADSLMAQYEKNNSPDWQWFDGALTYDNAVLPHALFAAGSILGGKFLEVAEKTCEFLLGNTFTAEHAETAEKNYKIISANSAVSAVKNGHFSFIGSEGWYKRGGKRATFDQQPIEAASTSLMLRAAYDATGNNKYLTLQRKAFAWFLGENDLHIPLYDSETKGCGDGLMSDGVNPNQGAESTLSFLLSLLTIVEKNDKKSRQ